MGGPGDRLIFNLLRELADVIVVGAGTVRIEGYSGAQLGVPARQRRQARGQSEVPPLAIVTKSGRLDRDMAVFTRTEVPPLVLTCTAAVEETRRLLSGLCDVVDCSADDPGQVDEAAMLATLAERGLRRILTEGGPTLLGSFVAARPARRALPDDRALRRRRHGQAHRVGPGPAADPDALRPHPDRRRGLPLHPIRQGLTKPAATVVGMSRQITRAATVAGRWSMTQCWPAASPAWPRTRASPPIPAPGRRAAPDEAAAQRSATDRGAQERPVLARLHGAGLQRRGGAPRPRRPARLRELRHRSRPGQRRVRAP